MNAAIGLFGGTFDPIHLGHIRMAEAFQHELGLSRVHLIPAGQPYHRTGGSQATGEQRLEMVRRAIVNQPDMQVDTREISRNKPAYTVETLEEIRQELPTDTIIWLLIGGDSLAQLHTWHRWQELFTLCNIAVAMRPGIIIETLPDIIKAEWNTRQVFDFSKPASCGTIRPLTLPPLDISATEVRRRLALQENCSDILNPDVETYIRQQGLYC